MMYLRFLITSLFLIVFIVSCKEENQNKIENNNEVTEDFIKDYYPNGRVMIDCQLKDGKLHGICKIYYPNGNLKYKTLNKDGEPGFIFQEFTPNGDLKVDTTKAIVIAADTVKINEIMSAQVKLSDPTKDFHGYFGKHNDTFFVGKYYYLIVENKTAFIEVTPTTLGKHSLQGVLRLYNDSMLLQPYPFTHNYFVTD